MKKYVLISKPLRKFDNYFFKKKILKNFLTDKKFSLNQASLPKFKDKMSGENIRIKIKSER